MGEYEADIETDREIKSNKKVFRWIPTDQNLIDNVEYPHSIKSFKDYPYTSNELCVDSEVSSVNQNENNLCETFDNLEIGVEQYKQRFQALNKERRKIYGRENELPTSEVYREPSHKRHSP